MTLTTHAIVGATIAATVPSHPMLGFALGFGSHFLLDAITHWDCFFILKSVEKHGNDYMKSDMAINKNFIGDLFKIGIDGLFGLILIYIFFILYGNISVIALLAGAAGGMMPDFLTFVQMKFKHEPFMSLRRFHIWIHAKKNFEKNPLLGISLQIIFIVLVVSIFRFLG